jgi:hypothetical protein
MYSSMVLPPPSPQGLEVYHLASVRQACNEINVIHLNSQWFPIEIEGLGLRIPVVYQHLEQPRLCPHSFYGPKLINPTYLQFFLGPHITFHYCINILVLPLSPFNHHPAKEKSNFELFFIKKPIHRLVRGKQFEQSHIGLDVRGKDFIFPCTLGCVHGPMNYNPRTPISLPYSLQNSKNEHQFQNLNH